VVAEAAGVTVDRAEVRTAGLAGTSADFYLWLTGNGIPMGCRFVLSSRVPGPADRAQATQELSRTVWGLVSDPAKSSEARQGLYCLLGLD
jgi:hypothetical protein